MKNKRAIVVLICALSAPLPSPAQAFEDMFGLMFRMMLTMMNVMSDAALDNDSGGWGNNWGNNWGGLDSFNLGMGAWPMMSGFGSPFSSFGSSPWSGYSPWSASPWSSGRGNPFAGGYPGGFSPPYGGARPGGPGYGPAFLNTGPGRYGATSIIDGRWFGSSGEILEVSGNRFRLRHGRYTLKGAITVKNDIITMYSPQTRTATRYTFVRNQSGLLMQGMNGELLRFTRYLPGGIGRRF